MPGSAGSMASLGRGSGRAFWDAFSQCLSMAATLEAFSSTGDSTTTNSLPAKAPCKPQGPQESAESLQPHSTACSPGRGVPGHPGSPRRPAAMLPPLRPRNLLHPGLLLRAAGKEPEARLSWAQAHGPGPDLARNCERGAAAARTRSKGRRRAMASAWAWVVQT